MTTSGTYNFAPSLGELVLYAFNQAGVRSTALTQEHMSSAHMAANLILSRWSNQGVNLWTVELIEQPLTEGVSTYAVDPSVVMILDAYVRWQPNVDDVPIDRTILPISRSEYANYPNKSMQSNPTVFWFDRLISPTVTLWPVPDGLSATSLNYYVARQVQDANLPGGQNVDIPYRWLEAFADALAFRLSNIWNPEKAMGLKALADESYQIAANQDEENVQLYISPILAGYWRP